MGHGHQLSAAATRAENRNMLQSIPVARRLTSCLVLALAGLSFGAQADSNSFSGSFFTDDQLAIFLIDLPVAGDITAQTLSYGGGIDGSGRDILPGGFAPVLTLFDDSGNNVFGNVGSSNVCPLAGSFCWDASFTYAGAPAGHYTLVLSQDGNNPLGQFADGFSMTGQPNYTAQYLGFPDDARFNFVQIDGAQRTGAWELDLSMMGTVTAVPEPSGAALLAAGLTLVAMMRRRACY
jgi:hypothetical protein